MRFSEDCPFAPWSPPLCRRCDWGLAQHHRSVQCLRTHAERRHHIRIGAGAVHRRNTPRLQAARRGAWPANRPLRRPECAWRRAAWRGLLERGGRRRPLGLGGQSGGALALCQAFWCSATRCIVRRRVAVKRQRCAKEPIGNRHLALLLQLLLRGRARAEPVRKSGGADRCC